MVIGRRVHYMVEPELYVEEEILHGMKVYMVLKEIGG